MKEYKKNISKKEINKKMPEEKNFHVMGKINQGHYKNMSQSQSENATNNSSMNKVTKPLELNQNNFSAKMNENQYSQGSQQAAQNEKNLKAKNWNKNNKGK